MIGCYTIEVGDFSLLLGTFFIQPFQLACENLSLDFFIIYPAAQMISAGLSSAGFGTKSCSKSLNGSNLMESMPDFFGSLQSLIGISAALSTLAQFDDFNLNRESLELSTQLS